MTSSKGRIGRARFRKVIHSIQQRGHQQRLGLVPAEMLHVRSVVCWSIGSDASLLDRGVDGVSFEGGDEWVYFTPQVMPGLRISRTALERIMS